jgi:hypothetical protein
MEGVYISRSTTKKVVVSAWYISIPVGCSVAAELAEPAAAEGSNAVETKITTHERKDQYCYYINHKCHLNLWKKKTQRIC